jgi:hypothetical protein
VTTFQFNILVTPTLQRQPFGSIIELVPLAESITKLSAVCMVRIWHAWYFVRVWQTDPFIFVAIFLNLILATALRRRCGVFAPPHG